MTHIDILSQPDDPSSPLTNITTKTEMETAILLRNQRHSTKSLKMPFMMDPFLCHSIDPFDLNNKLDLLSNGGFIDSIPFNISLSPSQIEWIDSLTTILHDEIPLTISIEDFKSFFKRKREGTASSPSGRHIGHYKSMLECLCREMTKLPEIVTTLASISLITSSPLLCW